MHFKKTSVVLICGLMAAGCAKEPYSPIVDGVRAPNFQADLAQCRQVSTQKPVTKKGATGGAILGGLVGAADADSGDAISGAVAGAVVGGVIGNVDEKQEVAKARDQIVFQCMRGRGHKVVG